MGEMTQALYAHMNNKTIKKENSLMYIQNGSILLHVNHTLIYDYLKVWSQHSDFKVKFNFTRII
jgi:hypothetical protein